MDPQELVPLEAGFKISPRQHRTCNLASRSCYRAPLRICRLLILLIGIPTVFIMVPLYMRYRVFLGQMYPMSMTDMRLIDSKISPTWCQRQVVRSNATFNAFVLPGAPSMSEDLVPVSMTRELELEDDMKEYWGFYLLKGSSVTVSACVRFPGASLIMIKGYKHLQECAYIGDDSSEELDEIVEAYQKGLLSKSMYDEKLLELKKVDGKANQPNTMRRQKPGVSFHDPNVVSNVTSSENVPAADVTDHDPKELREILERLHALRQAAKTESLKYYQPPSHLMSLPALHRHRDANVDRDERKWLIFKDIDVNSNETERRMNTNHTLTPPRNKTTTKTQVNKETTIFKQGAKPNTNTTKVVNTQNGRNENATDTKHIDDFANENKTTNIFHNDIENKENVTVIKAKDVDENSKLKDIEGKTEKTIDVVEENLLTDLDETTSPLSEEDSKEVFEDVLKRLQALGDRGKRVLVKLHETMGVEYQEEESGVEADNIMSAVTGSNEELDRLRRVLVEAIDEEKTRAERKQKRKDAAQDARAKRELMLGQIQLEKELNEDDEERDLAAEEEPDGYAEHHSTVNETTALDMSNSEFWSSFSSSEEALLECEGLILNLPLTPHEQCTREANEDRSFAAAKANALTYRVPANGYYFFIFNSENEVQRNFIRARFDLQKTRYDVARSKLRECTNSTDRCDLPLDIFSTQKVVLEVPLRDNDSLWNEQFVIISECEPRTSIYLVCVIAVPVFIIVFAFQ